MLYNYINYINGSTNKKSFSVLILLNFVEISNSIEIRNKEIKEVNKNKTKQVFDEFY